MLERPRLRVVVVVRVEDRRAQPFRFISAGMFVVAEAWTGRLKYHDPEIDELLRSPFVATLKEYRNASFHFSPQYFDSRMQVFLNEPGA